MSKEKDDAIRRRSAGRSDDVFVANWTRRQIGIRMIS